MIPVPEERIITYHTVTLGALTREGHAQVEVSEQDESGHHYTRMLHVPAGLPGEHVTIAVEAPPQPRPGRRRRRWKPRPPRVWITEVHQPSPLRGEALCPVFGTCGGCQLQHMHYSAQLEWKREVVRQLLHDIGGFEDPPLQATVPCDIPWHYRNHMRFSVNHLGQPGLTARGSHRVLPLTKCPIAHEQINRVLKVLSQHVNPQPQALIRCATASNQVLIQPTQGEQVAQQLAETGLELRTETMEEILAGTTFRIRPSSFFQTNTAQAEKMAQIVLNGLLSSPNPSLTIVDAYCGVGTFALLLAGHVGKVIAIEESASAIKDAQWNARDVDNIEILKGKVEDILPTLSSKIDGFVIDPPRAGCQQIVLDALIQHPVAHIVYVSCDPSTLARDLNIVCHQHPTYRLCSVQPLDMFPQTAHIECIAVLERI
ncbi:MAG TPA: class I SAM-dependent RNA methyltransferase [Ktedonobacteraceae bacterium]|nr:class I SAM-dependent RNA methyltransferase [Ktedonobacteraceae bacterium]